MLIYIDTHNPISSKDSTHMMELIWFAMYVNPFVNMIMN